MYNPLIRFGKFKNFMYIWFMKKLIAYIISWTLFWVGHWTSLIMGAIPTLYTTYRWLMYKSMAVQDWANNKTPWSHINN